MQNQVLADPITHSTLTYVKIEEEKTVADYLNQLISSNRGLVKVFETAAERLQNKINEKILVDTGCIVAFESTVNYDIERAGNLKSMVFGGEGLFLATLQGTGRVWL